METVATLALTDENVQKACAVIENAFVTGAAGTNVEDSALGVLASILLAFGTDVFGKTA
jgi:hypothetical protein